MLKLLSKTLVVAVACLIATTAMAQEKKREGKKRPTPEQAFKDMGSKDGKVLSKEDYMATVKAKGRDEEKAKSRWTRLAGDKDSITFEDFKKKMDERRAEWKKKREKKEESK